MRHLFFFFFLSLLEEPLLLRGPAREAIPAARAGPGAAALPRSIGAGEGEGRRRLRPDKALGAGA